MLDGGREAGSGPRRVKGSVLFAAVLLAVFFIALFLLLFGAYCTFTHKKWALYDYGIYTNMIWNCGHGDWFRCLVDRSYLATHLSFSLALIGPLFLAWDSPLVLMVVQWVAFCGGCLCVYKACRRHRLPQVVTAAILCFMALWPFTQSVLLSSFHGVSMYLLLVPWLYYTCAFNRRWTPLPLLLLLGLREDAFIYALPVVMYFAIKDRWTAGYVYAGVALLYGLAASLLLFPWINGLSLFERRGGEVSAAAVLDIFSAEGLRARAWGMLWICLPFLVLIRRNMGRAILLAMVPVTVTMASGFARQYQLRNHYPAIVMAGMVIGMVEALGSSRSRQRCGWWDNPAVPAGLLVMLTIVAHAANGFLYFGKQYHRRVGVPHGTGPLILKAVGCIPKQGLLVVPFHLGGACANRPDILAWKHYDPDKHDMDLTFCRLDDIRGSLGTKYRKLLEEEVFGVRFFDGRYVLFQKGWPCDRNAEVAEAVDRAAMTLPLVRTFQHAGRNMTDRNGEGVRHWKPDRGRTPVTVAFGKSISLDPCRYRAVLEFRSVPPETDGAWGRFDLFEHGAETPLAGAEIEPSDSREYREQVLEFTLDETMRVEPRITGGLARLWLLTVEFVSLPRDSQ